MINKKPEIKIKSKKFYFVYFIIVSIIILLIFSYLIIGSFWEQFTKIKTIENFYSKQLELSKNPIPKINDYDPIKGFDSATITIYEYNNFICSNCDNIQNNLLLLEKLYGNQIRFVYKGLPITINPETRPSLNASYCAGEQNKFWDYKTILFQSQDELNNEKYVETAQILGLNLEKFTECLNSRKYDNVLEENLKGALKLEITSVPTVYINDVKVEGFFNYYTLKDIIDKKLKGEE